MKRRLFYFLIFVTFSLFLNGCLLLDIPMQIIKTALGVVGVVADIVNKLPKPPPGVF